MVAGVHFLPDDPADLVARKLLRTNLSDLAAMGAEPLGYLHDRLGSARHRRMRGSPPSPPALRPTRREFGLSLLGGDTTSTPGPISLSLTILGSVAPGAALRRQGASPGDGIWVTGSIGDGALGLLAATGRLADPDGCLADRYRLPRPRLELGMRLHGIAAAAMDVSDGLVQDVSHLCRAAGLGAEIAAADVPLSPAAARADMLPLCLCGGDDYELVLAVPPGREAALREAARAARTPVTRIGQFRAGPAAVTVRSVDGYRNDPAQGRLEPLRVNKNVWLLFLCQALVNASSIAQVSMSALIGYSLAGDKSLATLPYALQMTATMAASIPAGIIFARLGRKAGFYLGTLAMLLGTVIFGLGVLQGNFLLYCLGALPTGIGFGIGQHYRFAAAEVAQPQARSRAIALVMAGGVVSAILGPELVKHTTNLVSPVLFLGTYMAMSLLPVIGTILLSFSKMPPPPARNASPTPLRTIMARPAFVVAVIAGLVGYGAMNLIMAATPLQMMLCGFGVNDSTDVIRAHAIAMFAPGFITGRLIQRFGPHPVICAGGVLTIACAALSLAGSAYVTFVVALMLLGLGWNFMFVAATALLSTAHDARERVRAQAANDFIVFGTVAITSFSSGALHSHVGWVAVNATVVPPVVIALALVMWHRLSQIRIAAPLPAR